jgi:hypothetical protein
MFSSWGKKHGHEVRSWEKRTSRPHNYFVLFFKIPIVAVYLSSFPLQLMASYLPGNHLQANHYGQTTGSKDQTTSPKLYTC